MSQGPQPAASSSRIDSKSSALHWAWGFAPPLQHHYPGATEKHEL